MSPLMSPKRNPKFKSALFLLIPTSSVEGRDTYGPGDQKCVYNERERDSYGHIFFQKKMISLQKIKKIEKK